MEGAVLDEANVHNMIDNNFVVIKLMVDEKKELPQPIEVVENGKKVTLDTYGDRWSYLQRYKFQANAQPYYVILNNDGELLSGRSLMMRIYRSLLNSLRKVSKIIRNKVYAGID